MNRDLLHSVTASHIDRLNTLIADLREDNKRMRLTLRGLKDMCYLREEFTDPVILDNIDQALEKALFED